jgi:hypothetical protein
LVQNKDHDAFCADIVSARDFLWTENCQQWQEYTDKVIYMLGQQIDLLKNNIWKKITLKNIYSQERIEDILEGYEDGNIYFPEGRVYNINTYEVMENI